MKQKIKVAIISTKGFGYDGISSFIINNYRMFDHSKMECHLIYPSEWGNRDIIKSRKDEIEQTGGTCKLITKENGSFQYFKSLKAYLKSQSFDVAYIHGSSASIVLEMITAKMAGIKRIIPHSHNTTGNHVFLHKLLRPLVNFLATTRLGCGMDANKWMYGKKESVFIPNGIDLKKYAFSAAQRKIKRAELKIPEGTIVLGHVGAFNEQKNHEFLLQFFSRVKRNFGNLPVLLLCVGVGSKLSQIQQLSKKLGIDDCVKFLGQRTDVAELQNAFDVFVLPSLFEGFPIVAVEAQTSGLPCIVSETIDKTVDLCGLVKWLPIDNAELWSQEFYKIAKKNISRDTYAEFVREKGFGIEESSKKLETVLLN